MHIFVAITYKASGKIKFENIWISALNTHLKILIFIYRNEQKTPINKLLIIQCWQLLQCKVEFEFYHF